MEHDKHIREDMNGEDLAGLLESIDEMDLDANLREYEAIEDIALEEIEKIEIDIGEIDVADAAALEAAVGTADAKEEIYAEAPVSEVIEPAPAAVKKAKAPKEKKVAAPKIARDLASLPDEVFALRVGEPADKAAVLAKRPAQVKIAEKFDNLFVSLAAGRAPSVYALTCYRALKAAPGSLKMGDLVAALQATKYSIGTARSQAGQIAFLFTSLGVTDKIGGAYTLRPDSALAVMLDAALAARA